MAIVVGQGCRVSTRRVLVIGLVVLLICVMAAFIFAIDEYLFFKGGLFSVSEILHHETFEVTVLAFGLGVFFAAVGFAVHHKNRTTDIIAYPTMPITPTNLVAFQQTPRPDQPLG
jgi:hypothetical protein